MALPVYVQGPLPSEGGLYSLIIPGTGGHGSAGYFDCGDRFVVTKTEWEALNNAYNPDFNSEVFEQLKARIAELDEALGQAKAELRKRATDAALVEAAKTFLAAQAALAEAVA